MPNRPQPLSEAHRVDGFDCGEPSLNIWLAERALANERAGVSRTYVVLNGEAVVAYYALSAGSISYEIALASLRRDTPDPIPAIVLGRLAVDVRVQRSGLGRALLADALERCLNAAHIIGARAILVHALNDRAREFHLGLEFTALKSEPQTLYLRLDTLDASRVAR